ncbi:(Fe-S)-binding protein [Brevibacillus marinus]|uniref:(Fe-S)-binding protein n=1 Tax=Brevibacillus marinus TaxID=2496837 RepID=UPI000F82FBA0|nr:(Fe-S)-binding protein [Brevibacillus marinus]
MLQAVHYLAFVLVTGFAIGMFIRVVGSRIAFIRLGRLSPDASANPQRLKQFIGNVFGQKKVLKDKKSGIMHLVMFYGFIVIQFGAIELIGKGLVPGWELPLGNFHGLFSLIQEGTVALVLLAVGYAFYRRYIEKLPRLERNFKAGIVLLFIAALMVTELLSLGFEMLMLKRSANGYAPISSLIAVAGGHVLNEQVAAVCFYLFWWLHLLVLLAFLIYVPQSKHAHLLFAPLNWWIKDKSRPPGKLTKLDFSQLEAEDAEEYGFGAGRIEQFTQSQLIDLYACVECGRCTSMCPAAATGKSLSPMHLIIKMRDHLTEKGASLTSRSPWFPQAAFAMSAGSAATEAAAAEAPPSPLDVRLVGDVITEEELWACTTCRNCEDQCPVGNEHVSHIIDMRRYLLLTEGNVPTDAQRALTNIERHGNPWGIHRKERDKWREGMEHLTPLAKDTEEFEYLFFVGSMGSYDSRSMKITRSFVRIMHKAGIRFAILGSEEKNSGDTARRLGNELLFQQLAEENIALFNKYGVKKIVTIDPHAYNTFKHEYPEFGLTDVEVYHHTELLAQWLRERRLQPVREVKARVTYHDSCYLGRYNDVYAAPRAILSAIPGVEIVEMERSGSDSMCCGAGGGMMWQEEKQGTRINLARTEQALAVNPSIIGSACPYCLTMLSDGVKIKEAEGQVETLDLVEILERSLDLTG